MASGALARAVGTQHIVAGLRGVGGGERQRIARAAGGNPFLLDSPRPRIPLAAYTNRELRYRTLTNSDPAEAERLHALAEQAVEQRWDVYEEMATRGAQHFAADARKEGQ